MFVAFEYLSSKRNFITKYGGKNDIFIYWNELLCSRKNRIGQACRGVRHALRGTFNILCYYYYYCWNNDRFKNDLSDTSTVRRNCSLGIALISNFNIMFSAVIVRNGACTVRVLAYYFKAINTQLVPQACARTSYAK